MKLAMNNERRSFKPSFLMLSVLGAHVVAAAVFVTLSGCQTRRPAAVQVQPPPAPVLPPGLEPAPPVAATPRPAIRPPVAVEPMPSAADAPVYFVQKGDSLSKIAKNAGVSAAEIAELNRITDPNKIRVGQRLLLPVHARSLPSAPPAVVPAAKPAAPAKPAAGPVTDSGNTHTVRAGDTLTKIANRYNTSVTALLELNNMKRDAIIKVGQTIKLPSASGAGAAVAPARSTPPVASAPQPAVTPAPAPVVPAPEPVIQPVIIEEAPAPAPALETPDVSSSSGEAPFPYTVKEGDTLDSIAIKFSARKDVIMALNNLSGDAVRPGQRILIPWQ